MVETGVMSMLKYNKVKPIVLILCLSFLFLSGCTPASDVTFEQLAKWQDGVFISEFGEFSVEIPQNWTILNSSEIKEQVDGQVKNVIYGTPEVSIEQFQKTDGFYPMAMTTEVENDLGEKTFAMVVVIIERMRPLDKLKVKTADEYLEIIKGGYREGETAGNTFSFEEIYSKNIGDVEYRCLPIRVESYQYRQVIAARIKDDYVFGFLIMTTDNHQKMTEEALGAFSGFP
jgi:hypothetical protein